MSESALESGIAVRGRPWGDVASVEPASPLSEYRRRTIEALAREQERGAAMTAEELAERSERR